MPLPQGWNTAVSGVSHHHHTPTGPPHKWHDRYPKGCAGTGSVPCQHHTREGMGKPKSTSPQQNIGVTMYSPVGEKPVVTLIRTDTTLDHSQKAEKVCWPKLRCCGCRQPRQQAQQNKRERGFLSSRNCAVCCAFTGQGHGHWRYRSHFGSRYKLGC